MNAYQVYKMILAVQMHFKQESYDYFKYQGKTRGKLKNFEQNKDAFRYLKISRMRNPEAFIIGNVLFNPSQWVGDFDERYATQYEKYITNGTYLFQQELNKLKPVFNENFDVDTSQSVPYILHLLMNNTISLHMCCVFESVLGCDSKWSRLDKYIIFSNLSKKIVKSTPFFHVDNDKYKALIMKHFTD